MAAINFKMTANNFKMAASNLPQIKLTTCDLSKLKVLTPGVEHKLEYKYM